MMLVTHLCLSRLTKYQNKECVERHHPKHMLLLNKDKLCQEEKLLLDLIGNY